MCFGPFKRDDSPAPAHPRPTIGPGSYRYRRSIVNKNIALPKELEYKLPLSFHDIDLTYDVTTNTTDLVNSVTGILLVVQLMISGHSKGRPYLDEICSSSYPTEYLKVRFQ